MITNEATPTIIDKNLEISTVNHDLAETFEQLDLLAQLAAVGRMLLLNTPTEELPPAMRALKTRMMDQAQALAEKGNIDAISSRYSLPELPSCMALYNFPG